ncbi:MAG: ribonuclease H family protein [Chloroflexi bacterium]|nr:ribonuclease H family protein [Chloroflexota bacterium]MCL5274296.1 ribonuclease H family protein [Chloroflexota bacterium]
MAKAQKFYVVWKGRTPGIYPTWDECKAQVDGFTDAKFKAFSNQAQAEAAYRQAYANHVVARNPAGPSPAVAARSQLHSDVIADSYTVDAACSGNPGVLEYRCVHTGTGKVVFQRGPFKHGTNNIGEFLSIVQALMWLRQKHSSAPVYSDSKIAIGWVKARACRTKLAQTRNNGDLFVLIGQAEQWLRENRYENKLLKWETEKWGENPADFGRK